MYQLPVHRLAEWTADLIDKIRHRETWQRWLSELREGQSGTVPEDGRCPICGEYLTEIAVATAGGATVCGDPACEDAMREERW